MTWLEPGTYTLSQELQPRAIGPSCESFVPHRLLYRSQVCRYSATAEDLCLEAGTVWCGGSYTCLHRTSYKHGETDLYSEFAAHQTLQVNWRQFVVFFQLLIHIICYLRHYFWYLATSMLVFLVSLFLPREDPLSYSFPHRFPPLRLQNPDDWRDILSSLSQGNNASSKVWVQGGRHDVSLTITVDLLCKIPLSILFTHVEHFAS